MSIIQAGNTTTTSLIYTGDTTGNLVFTTGGANTVALTIDSTQNITTTQKFASASMPTGSILQVVQANTSTEVTTTSNTFVTSGLTASITPKFSTSKILVIANIGDAYAATAARNSVYTLYRNSTNISPAGTGLLTGFATVRSDAGALQTPAGMSFLDSPATTSSTTYAVYMANFSSGFVTGAQLNGAVSTMTLMEIAG